MKHQLAISGKTVLLTQIQLEILMTAVQDAEILGEKHVGNGLGSQGYQKAYLPIIETKHPHEWLTTMVMSNEFIESTKFVTKLDPREP